MRQVSGVMVAFNLCMLFKMFPLHSLCHQSKSESQVLETASNAWKMRAAAKLRNLPGVSHNSNGTAVPCWKVNRFSPSLPLLLYVFSKENCKWLDQIYGIPCRKKKSYLDLKRCKEFSRFLTCTFLQTQRCALTKCLEVPLAHGSCQQSRIFQAHWPSKVILGRRKAALPLLREDKLEIRCISYLLFLLNWH